jgi:hypothetical protein
MIPAKPRIIAASVVSWTPKRRRKSARASPRTFSILVLYENFAADYETSTLNLLERLGLSCPEDFEFEPRMKKQSDKINDDWTRRYSELRLGRDFDLVPAKVDQPVR